MKPFAIRLPFSKGRILYTPDRGEALLTAGQLFDSHLIATHKRGDEIVAEHDLGSGLVTNAGVAFLVDDWDDNTTDITNFNFHDSGTGTTAANVSDTALETAAGIARESGTKSQPSANVIRTVATITYDGSYAITEWGLFSASSNGTLWDRRVFSAINVEDQDSIEFTYSLTVQAGG